MLNECEADLQQDEVANSGDIVLYPSFLEELLLKTLWGLRVCFEDAAPVLKKGRRL
jgi:hypothetical protein